MTTRKHMEGNHDSNGMTDLKRTYRYAALTGTVLAVLRKYCPALACFNVLKYGFDQGCLSIYVHCFDSGSSIFLLKVVVVTHVQGLHLEFFRSNLKTERRVKTSGGYERSPGGRSTCHDPHQQKMERNVVRFRGGVCKTPSKPMMSTLECYPRGGRCLTGTSDVFEWSSPIFIIFKYRNIKVLQQASISTPIVTPTTASRAECWDLSSFKDRSGKSEGVMNQEPAVCTCSSKLLL